MVSPARTDLTPQPAHRRLRVLLVSPEPFFALRGTPINVRQMVRVLCAAGHEVHLATYPLGEPVTIPGLFVDRARRPPGISSVPIGFSWRKVALDLALAARVWRRLATGEFDVVHAVEESVFFSLPAAARRGIPVIYDLDSWLSEQLADGGSLGMRMLAAVARRLERASLRRADVAITACRLLTDSARAAAPALPVVQIEDCPMEETLRAADRDAVSRLRAELHLDGARVAVYAGNLEPYQGIDLLLAAFEHVVARCADAHLVVVGGESAQVTRAVASLARRGLAARVLFTGAQPPSRLPEFMALGDVLVSPRATGRNTPLKLYSYMASGVPIVATDLPTHTQVLDAETACLCAPEPLAMAAAITGVFADPARYAPRGAAARERVRTHFSHAQFAARLLGAYEELAAATLANRATSR